MVDDQEKRLSLVEVVQNSLSAELVSIRDAMKMFTDSQHRVEMKLSELSVSTRAALDSILTLTKEHASRITSHHDEIFGRDGIKETLYALRVRQQDQIRKEDQRGRAIFRLVLVMLPFVMGAFLVGLKVMIKEG